jgi:hypothetical protein
MQTRKLLELKTKNPDFELAETKATKAIQKHSMNIDGTEKIIKSMRLICC